MAAVVISPVASIVPQVISPLLVIIVLPSSPNPAEPRVAPGCDVTVPEAEVVEEPVIVNPEGPVCVDPAVELLPSALVVVTPPVVAVPALVILPEVSTTVLPLASSMPPLAVIFPFASTKG